MIAEISDECIWIQDTGIHTHLIQNLKLYLNPALKILHRLVLRLNSKPIVESPDSRLMMLVDICEILTNPIFLWIQIFHLKIPLIAENRVLAE